MLVAASALSVAPARDGSAGALQGSTESKTSLDLCPVSRFRDALRLVSSKLPGAIEGAGGFEAVVDAYESRYGAARCDGFSNHGAWPESHRRSDGRPGLVVNAGEGTTGTTCLDAAFVKLGLNSAHYSEDMRRQSVWKCTNASWSHGDADCTSAYDAHDVVSDTPVAYQLPYVLSSHPGEELAGALLTVRDPKDWAIRRLEHESDDVVNAVPCGCRVGWADRAMPGTKQADLAQCAALEKVSTDLEGQQRTLIYDAWAACIIQESGHRVFVFNLFELDVDDQATQLASALKGLGAFPADLSAAQMKAAMHESLECSVG